MPPKCFKCHSCGIFTATTSVPSIFNGAKKSLCKPCIERYTEDLKAETRRTGEDAVAKRRGELDERRKQANELQADVDRVRWEGRERKGEPYFDKVTEEWVDRFVED